MQINHLTMRGYQFFCGIISCKTAVPKNNKIRIIIVYICIVNYNNYVYSVKNSIMMSQCDVIIYMLTVLITGWHTATHNAYLKCMILDV